VISVKIGPQGLWFTSTVCKSPTSPKFNALTADLGKLTDTNQLTPVITPGSVEQRFICGAVQVEYALQVENLAAANGGKLPVYVTAKCLGNVYMLGARVAGEPYLFVTRTGTVSGRTWERAPRRLHSAEVIT
jgi:hypothetical protein